PRLPWTAKQLHHESKDEQKRKQPVPDGKGFRGQGADGAAPEVERLALGRQRQARTDEGPQSEPPRAPHRQLPPSRLTPSLETTKLGAFKAFNPSATAARRCCASLSARLRSEFCSAKCAANRRLPSASWALTTSSWLSCRALCASAHTAASPVVAQAALR